MNKTRRGQIQEVINDLSEIKQRIEKLQSDEEDAFDSIPENLQDSFRGSQSQDAIDSLGEAVESIEEALDSLNEATF